MAENWRERVTIESEHVLIVKTGQLARGWHEQSGAGVKPQMPTEIDSIPCASMRSLSKDCRDALPRLTATRFLVGCEKHLVWLLHFIRNGKPSR